MLSLLSLAFAAWPPIDVVPTSPHPDDVAVVVGIENYLLVDDVPGARWNAEDWYLWLVKGRGLPPAKVHLLRDTEASRERIEAQLDKAAAEVGPEGTLWVVFIGHGAPTPDGLDGVLVGMDAQSDPDSLYARSVKRSRVVQTMDGANAARRILVLDTCFSGQSAGGALLRGLQPVIPSYALKPAGSTTVLTAGSATQFAGPLPGSGRPGFSYLILGALTGWGDLDGDGSITSTETVQYANDTLAATLQGRTQTPEHLGQALALSTAPRSEGPDVAQIVLQAGPPRLPPAVPQDEALRLVVQQQAHELAAARERARLEALEASTRNALQRAAEELQARASEEWKALAGAPQQSAVLEFVERYGGAEVSVGEARQRVDVPQVRAARSWLEGGRASTEPATPWAVNDPRFAPLLLWQPMEDWRQGLEAAPDQIWAPYQWLHAVPSATPEPFRQVAEQAVGDAMTYAGAWARTADPQRRRDLAFALRGLMLETQEGYREAFPPEAVPGWLQDPVALQAEPHGEALLTAAIVELSQRAESCDKIAPKLQELRDSSAAFLERHAAAVKLAAKVSKCAP